MASKTTATLALFLSLNLLLFSLTSARTYVPIAKGTCPIDALKLGVCANLLGDLLKLEVGTPPVKPCCTLIEGLVDLEAAACLCTVIKANVLNLVHLNVPLSLSLLLNACGRPTGFQCP